MGIDRRAFLRALGAVVSAPFLVAASCGRNGAGGPVTAAVSTRGAAMPEGKTMDFNAVGLGDFSESACTPRIDDDFIGIRINAPERVVAGQDQFAICGTYRFSAEYVYSFSYISEAVVLVAVDAERHTPFACNLAEPDSPDPGSEPPPAPKDPDWMTEHRIQKYFNVDLLQYMRGLPERSATYYIYAIIENHVSNVCKVRFEA